MYIVRWGYLLSGWRLFLLARWSSWLGDRSRFRRQPGRQWPRADRKDL